ncbi:MAG: hypothetical protein LBD21_09500 [Tannerellaceae bacterium]|jgi:hypothetical protein|nr:hypothetical protein [Tannerellaceae bacterium]
MKLVEHNPYRIVGLLANATRRDIDRQTRRCKQLLEAQSPLPEDYSITPLGRLNRKVEDITGAASKLNSDADKMGAALFWFYNGHHTDEPAFNALNAGRLEDVLGIWGKRTSGKDVSDSNASAFSNLSTLYLSGVLTVAHEAALKEGISLKLKFLESAFARNLQSLVTDETYKTTNEELQLLFLKQIQSEIEGSKVYSINKLIKVLEGLTFSAKEKFLSSFITGPINRIESAIEVSIGKREKDNANAITYGNELYNTTTAPLKLLTAILPSSDLKLISISDRLATEILQCSKDYFDNHPDKGDAAIALNKKAKSIALGKDAKDRIDKHTTHVNGFVTFINDINFVKSKLEGFSSLKTTIANARDFEKSCRPKLMNLKDKLGAEHENYLDFSSGVVKRVMDMIITLVNDETTLFKEAFQRYHANAIDYSKVRPIANRRGVSVESLIASADIDTFKTLITEALDVFRKLKTLDMVADLRVRYNQLLSDLESLYKQLHTDTKTPVPQPKPQPKKKKKKKAWLWTILIIAIIISVLLIISQS